MGIEGDYINGNHSCCFAVSAERKAKAKAVLLITIAAAFTLWRKMHQVSVSHNILFGIEQSPLTLVAGHAPSVRHWCRFHTPDHYRCRVDMKET